jgi:hypothetical protein
MTKGLNRDERRNAVKLVLGKTATKLGDTLTNPKTVLTWLLTTIGAPGAAISMLVPIRESGSMLPQLFISGWVQRFRVRKWVFAGGAAAQALAIAAMGLAAMTLNPTSVGVAVILALAGFAIARAFCSVSSKDVLGRAIPKGFRGRVNGLSKTASGLLSATAAVGLLLYRGEGDARFFAWLLIGASGLWLIGGLSHAWVREPVPERPTADQEKSGSNGLRARIGLVARDRLFRRFILARGFLLGTALAAPLLVVLGQQNDGQLDALVGFIIAGGVATSSSSFFWGRLADRAGHLAMAAGGMLATAAGSVAIAVQWHGGIAETAWVWPLLFLVFNLGYTGVRMGRKTWVVDAAEGDRRTDYVAASNTLIAVLILIVGGISAPLQQISVLASLGFYVGLSAIGAVLALGLKLDTADGNRETET